VLESPLSPLEGAARFTQSGRGFLKMRLSLKGQRPTIKKRRFRMR
jgi:hypothetical protein